MTIGSAWSDGGDIVSSGDIDGDGFSDVLLGAPSETVANLNTAGQVYGYRGGPAGLEVMPSWALNKNPTQADFFGRQVQVLRDLDGDGFPEVAVGSDTITSGGRVDVFRGSANGPEPAPAWTYVGPTVNDNMGYYLAHGDVNGDGLTDLVMSTQMAFEHLDGTGDGSGGATIVLGVPGGLAPEPAWTYRCASDHTCSHLAVADLDNDGYAEVMLASSDGDSEVKLLVFPGGPDGDGDGAPDARDCDPVDAAIHPGAEEVPYDGVDQDCRQDDDYDADRDGVRPPPWGIDPDDLDDDWTMTLSIGGTCSSGLTIDLAGATPGGDVEWFEGELVQPPYTGGYIPGPCLDSQVESDLTSLRSSVGVLAADANGEVFRTLAPMASASCPTYVQALDHGTCKLSPPVAVAP